MREKTSEQPPPTPTVSIVGPCPTIIQISRLPGKCQKGSLAICRDLGVSDLAMLNI